MAIFDGKYNAYRNEVVAGLAMGAAASLNGSKVTFSWFPWSSFPTKAALSLSQLLDGSHLEVSLPVLVCKVPIGPSIFIGVGNIWLIPFYSI